MVLEELDLPHEFSPMTMADVKKPEYLAVNPNGRIPAIHDPNTGITLWESGAIIEYLVENYDKDHRLSFPQGTPESYHTRQWLYYQVTGQGPYYGQASWFLHFHPEKLPSAIERYANEVNRVSSVLEKVLGEQKEKYGKTPGFNGPWLVGNKMTFADLVFIPWQGVIAIFLEKDVYSLDKYPHVKEWIQHMVSRPKVKSVLEWGDRPIKFKDLDY